MSDSERRSFCSILKPFVPVIALTIFLCPAAAIAEPFLILQNTANSRPPHEQGVQPAKRSFTVGLNKNGDLMMRLHDDASLIVAYNPPGEVIDYQERIRNAQRQDCPTISGISLKFSLLF